MMIFPDMLTAAAKRAGMRVPRNPDKFDARKFPHFQVFCNLQLCRPIRFGEHWENAEIIAKVPLAKLKKMTLADFLALGIHYQQ